MLKSVVVQGTVDAEGQRAKMAKDKYIPDLLLVIPRPLVGQGDTVQDMPWPQWLVLMGKLPLDMAQDTLDLSVKERVSEVDRMEQIWRMSAQYELLMCSEGERRAMTAGGMCMTCTSVCNQCRGLKNELTHLVYP